MGKKIYLRKDGNGGISISIPLAFIMATVTLLGMILPAVAAYGGLNQRVAFLEDTSATDSYRIDSLEQLAAKTDASLCSIKDSITEIKTDIKEVKSDVTSSKLAIERLNAKL